jgi:rhamnogalacturonan endolyase
MIETKHHRECKLREPCQCDPCNRLDNPKTCSAGLAIYLSSVMAVCFGLVGVPFAQPTRDSAATPSVGIPPSPQKLEPLDRGVVAVPRPEGGCFVSWRLLVDDPPGTAFNVYWWTGTGRPKLLNPQPLGLGTFFIDESYSPTFAGEYLVKAVIGGVESDRFGRFKLPANASAGYFAIPLDTPDNYHPNEATVADLDGDGQYEIILHQSGRGHDNTHEGITDPVILQAYKLDGTKMWEINLGKNIREGAHYAHFMAYDLDGDGRAEIACKTADGTVDGTGQVLGERRADHRDRNGRILKGPEYLTVFDGRSGAKLATTGYLPQRHPDTDDPTADQMKEVWDDGYGNRIDRFLACVAYLDGKRPSLVMCRGYYSRSVLVAWDFRDGALTHRWTFDSSASRENRIYGGQGNHGLSVADVDSDGKDEIIYGGCTIDDDGTGLYSTRLGHGDALHVSDLDPLRPGLEVFRIQEPARDAGAHFYDAASGKVLWRKPTRSGSKEGPGRGIAADIDPRHPGAESWVGGGGIRGLFDARGNPISEKTPVSCNFAVWWDGDLLREILDGNWIGKWNWEKSELERILTAEGSRASNGSKSTPVLSGDILGDWREEVIWRSADNRELRIYTTTLPTEHRMVTLMQDRQYRLAIAWQNIGYNQPPHPGFHLGAAPAASAP